MDRSERIIKLKLDVIFKRIFGNAQNDDIIKAFIEDLLEMPHGTIEEIIIENVELPPDQLYKKFSRLDLKMRVNGQLVNIELQVKAEEDFGDRTLFYWAKIFTEELGAGDEYGDLRKTICINIINFNYFGCEEYHSHFQPMELHRHEVLSDKMDIHFFELKKLHKAPQQKPMEDWLNLINAETEGDLMDIQNVTQSSEVKKAIVILREMNADARIRQEAYYREKRLHDEATALGHARREGLAEGEAKGILVTLRDLVNKGLLTLTQAAAQAGMTVPEFENKVRLL